MIIKYGRLDSGCDFSRRYVLKYQTGLGRIVSEHFMRVIIAHERNLVAAMPRTVPHDKSSGGVIPCNFTRFVASQGCERKAFLLSEILNLKGGAHRSALTA